MHMKNHLYRILSCALLLFASTTSVLAENGIKETKYYTICPGDTIRLESERLVVITKSTILYDTMHMTSPDEDSIIAYVVNLYPRFEKDEYKRLQKGESYEWQGTTISDPGVYERIYYSQEGCDSIYRLHVTQQIDSAITFTLCDEESVSFNGRTYSNAGVYTDILSGDTVYTITIIKHPSREFVQYGVLDRTHPYYWQYTLDGELKTDTIYEPGRYVYTSQNPETGCNDRWILILTKDETSFHSIETVTICESEDFSWRNHHGLNKLGVGQTIHYYDRYRTAADQDSIYELILTVKPTLRSTRTIPFCGSIEWNGKTYTESTTIVDSMKSVQFSCDSIVTTILVKGTPVTHRDTISILGGETLMWHGRPITQAGDYTDVHNSAYGCDTTFYLHVEVKEPAHTMNTHSEWYSICQGDGQLWRGDIYYNSGIYYDTIKTAGGEIDSLYILYLTVNPTYAWSERVTFLSFPTTYREQTIPSPGAYTFTYQSSLGCDSIITSYIDLEVYRDEQTVTICPGETHIWNYDGETYTVSGKYTKVEQNAAGHDSVIHILNLTVRYIPETQIEHTMCKGETYIFADQSLTKSGVYRHTYHKTGGCDSVVVLSLNVLSPDTTYLAIQRPQGESIVWDGETIRQPGMYFHYGTNRFGCDSVSILQFTYNQVDTVSVTLTVCPNELPFEWNGISANQTNRYTRLVKEANGNYTYYVLDLTVREVAQRDTTLSICEGGSITFNGVTYDEAGHYRTYLTCDTLINVHIVVNQPVIYETHGTITDDHGFTWQYIDHGTPEEKEFKVAGTYEFENPNPTTGCNDIYRLILTKDETSYHFEESLTICEGDDFTWHGLSNLSSITGTNTYTDKYETRAGKDSIYTLHLTVIPVERTVRTIFFCGETSWNGKTYTESTVVYDTISLPTGCYRIERINLDKEATFYHKETKELPQGTVLHWHGQNITTDGTYYDYGTTVNGCDSTYEITVTIIPASPQTNQYAEELSTCEGDTIVWRGKDIWRSGVYVDTVYAAGTNAIDSIFTLTFTAWPAPKDTIIQHLYTCSDGAAIRYDGKDYYTDQVVITNFKTIHNCDSIVKVFLHFNTALALSRTDTITDQQLPYTWTYQLYDNTRRDTILTKSGTYTHTVASEGGCTNQETLDLVVLKTYLFELDTTICETDLPLLWRGQYLQHTIGETKQYEDVLKTVNNTDSIYRINLTIDPAPKRVERIAICENKDTIINGKSYFDPILYPVGLVFRDTMYKNNGANECDSIIYYEITKTPQRHIIETRILHVDESFEWHGMTISDPETKTYTIEDEIDPNTGCEIIYQIRVIAEDRKNDAVCETELPYLWDQTNKEYYNTGLYTDTTYDAEGKITAFYTLNLRVDTVPKATEYYYVCYGHPEDYYGRRFGDDPTKKDYVEQFTQPYSVPGSVCTGELTVVVTVSSEKQRTETVILRAGETLDWKKYHITTGGEYKDTTKIDGQCDSINILRVIEEQRKEVTVCTNDTAADTHPDKKYPYLWPQTNEEYKTSGIYTDTVFDADGYMTEFYALYLTVTQPYDTTIYVHGCDNTGAHWRDQVYWKDTTFVDRVPVQPYDPSSPCDSVFHVNIIIDKTYYTYIDTTLCEYQLPLIIGRVNPDTIWEERNFRHPYDTTKCGCDSIIEGHLTIIPKLEKNDSTFICEGDVVTLGDLVHPAFLDNDEEKWAGKWEGKWHGVDYTEDTIVWDCDHRYFHHIIRRPNQKIVPEKTFFLCPEDTLQLFWPYDTTWFCHDTVYEEHRPMDSIWTDPVHGITYKSDAYTCDSVTRWFIKVLPKYHKDTTAHKLLGDSIWWGGAWRYYTGIYDSIAPSPDTNSLGDTCMYIYPLHLIVDTAYLFKDTVTICTPSQKTWKYTWPETGHVQEYTVGTTDTMYRHYYDSLITYDRRDSVYDLCVNYSIIRDTLIFDTICEDTRRRFDSHHGTVERWVDKAGRYVDTLTALNGCDSIVTLQLFVRPRIITAPQEAMITDREIPYLWKHSWMEDGQRTEQTDTLRATGLYTFRMPSIHGCDSIDSLYLTVHQTHVFRDTIDVCDALNKSRKHTWYTGYIQEYNTPLMDDTAFYADTLETRIKYDSIYVLCVNFHQTYETLVRDTICEGERYRFDLHQGTQTTERWFETAGTYYDTVESRYGCDSVIVLKLFVRNRIPVTHPIVHIPDTAAPYLWYHKWSTSDSTQILSASGEYEFRMPSIYGCDSIDSLSLFIHKTYRIQEDSITICYDQTPYTWQDRNDITKTSDLVFHALTHDGYDSIRYVHIEVLPLMKTVIRDTLCDGDSLQFGLTKAHEIRFVHRTGVYYDTLTSNQYGCDSIIELRLNVYDKYFNEHTKHISVADTPYVWEHVQGGVVIERDTLHLSGGQTEGYTYTFTSTHGCDSIDSLTLHVHQTYLYRDSVVICSDETPYSWEGITDIYTTNEYIKTLRTHDGYDSTHVRYVEVRPVLHTLLTHTICEGDSLRFGLSKQNKERFLTDAGVYYDTLTSNQYGCDSIIELRLNVYPKHINHQVVDIADTQLPYLWEHIQGGQTIGSEVLNGTGEYSYHFTTEFGCDSIDSLSLRVHRTYNIVEDTIQLCSDEIPYTWCSYTNISETNDYIYYGQTFDGYDSIRTVHINVWPVKYTTLEGSICEGHSYKFKGKDYTEQGTYYDTLTTSHGCDSIVTLHLTVHQPYFNTRTEHIFEGQQVAFFDTICRTTGTYYHFGTTPQGCDSTTVLQLFVHPLVDTIVTICSYDLPYIWTNKWDGTQTPLYTAGIYRNDTSYVDGERMFYGLQLVVNETLHDTIHAAICEGTSYPFIGMDITEPGTYRDTTQGSNGCDSITTLILTVNKAYYSIIRETILEGNSYVFYGDTLDSTGTYTHYARTPEGCDSTTVLELTVHQLVDTVVTVCSSELPYIWHNHWSGLEEKFYTAGTYRNDTMVNKGRLYYGVQLIVTEPTSTTIYREICEGDKYNFNNRLLEFAGEYRDTIKNGDGCDSVIVLHLNVLSKYYHTVTASIYEGDSVLFQGQYFKEAGAYPFRFTSSFGCDSVVELQLSVNRLYEDSVAVCSNELPYLWHGKTIYESGVYRDTILNTEGKETVVGVKVNVLPIFRATEPINVTICEGDYYKFGRNILTEQGSYYDTLTAANGCDSIVMLALRVIPVKYQTTTKRIFEGDSTLFNGVWYKESGVYEYREINEYGCSDTYQLILTVLKSFNIDTTAVICDNELPFIWRGYEYNESGDYSLPIAWTDSSRVVKTLHLTVNNTYYLEQNISLCAGDTFRFNGKQYFESGFFYDTVPSLVGCDSVTKYILSVHPSVDKIIEKHISDKQPYNFHGRELTLTGTYEWTGKTIHGCDSIEHLYLTVHPSFFQSDTLDLCQSDSINYPYVWQDPNGRIIATISQTGTYSDSVLTEYGFDSVHQLVVYVHPSYFIREQYEIGVGEHLKIHGRDISQPAIYYDTLRTIHGCDSIFHVVVNQKRTREWTWDREICQGEYFEFFGRKLTHTGQYKYTSQYKDSIITLNLTVNPISITETRKVITDKQIPYIYNGRIYEQGGVYNDTLVNKFGCDSILRFVLIVSSRYSDWTPMPLCPGSEIKIDGEVITEAGLYTFLRRSRVTGEMDSIWRVEVYDAPAFEFADTISLCEGDTVFYGNVPITHGGNQDIKLKTVEGCDSIYHLHVTVYPSYSFDTTVTIFDYQTFTWEQNHQNYTVEGTYTKTFPTKQDPYHTCDSTYVLNLKVIPTTRHSMEYTICDGQEYTWRGKTYSKEGFYYDTVANMATFVSAIYSLHLTVSYPTYIMSATATSICADDKTYSIAFEYDGAKPTMYSIYYDQRAKDEGFKDVINKPFLGEDQFAIDSVPTKTDVIYLEHTSYIKPNKYYLSLVLDNGVCGQSRAENIELNVKYPSWIIEQNWNDIVVPLKKELNGGYEFSQADWIVNGVRQLNNGRGYLEYNFRDGDEVVMIATRKGENYAIETCPLIISINPNMAYDDPILIYPTQAPRQMPNIHIEAPKDGTYEVYGSTGTLLFTGTFNEGETLVTLPAVSGIYFIRTTAQGAEPETHKVIIY